MKVTGRVNEDPVEFLESSPEHYAADVAPAPDGAYRTAVTAEDEYGNVGVAFETVYADDAWITPVWWRTREDVDRASHLNRRIAAGGGLHALSPGEQQEWLTALIGALNFWDLNRIEIDTRYLDWVLEGYGYGIGAGEGRGEYKTDWAMEDLPASADLERIRSGVQDLILRYHPQQTPLPHTLEQPDYQAINDLERVLKEIYDMVERMKRSFRWCAAPSSVCGEEVGLP